MFPASINISIVSHRVWDCKRFSSLFSAFENNCVIFHYFLHCTLLLQQQKVCYKDKHLGHKKEREGSFYGAYRRARWRRRAAQPSIIGFSAADVYQPLQMLFSMVDLAVVGRFSSSAAMGSVGSTNAFIFLPGLSDGSGSGANARRHALWRAQRKMRESVHTSFLVCLDRRFLTSRSGLSFARPLELLNTREDSHRRCRALPAHLLPRYARRRASWLGTTVQRRFERHRRYEMKTPLILPLHRRRAECWPRPHVRHRPQHVDRRRGACKHDLPSVSAD